MGLENIDKKEVLSYEISRKLSNLEKKLFENIMLKVKNKDFLGLKVTERLKYITVGSAEASKLKRGQKLEFNFHFNGKLNRNLYLKTTAGQVLPEKVESVICDGKVYKRSNLDGEFFTENNSRLKIKTGTRIEILDIRNDKKVSELQQKSQEKYEKYLKENKNLNYDEKLIVKNLANRGFEINSKVVNYLKEELKGLSRKEKFLKLEDLLTEIDRERGRKRKTIITPDFFSNIFSVKNTTQPRNYVEKNLPSYFPKKRTEYVTRKRLTISPAEQTEIISSSPMYIKNLVKKYFPQSEFENAILVCYGESSFDPNEKNKNFKYGKLHSTDRGLFQVNDYWHFEKYAGKNIYDPETNVKVAAQIFKEAGNSWKRWYAAKKFGIV